MQNYFLSLSTNVFKRILIQTFLFVNDYGETEKVLRSRGYIGYNFDAKIFFAPILQSITELPAGISINPQAEPDCLPSGVWLPFAKHSNSFGCFKSASS